MSLLNALRLVTRHGHILKATKRFDDGGFDLSKTNNLQISYIWSICKVGLKNQTFNINIYNDSIAGLKTASVCLCFFVIAKGEIGKNPEIIRKGFDPAMGRIWRWRDNGEFQLVAGYVYLTKPTHSEHLCCLTPGMKDGCNTELVFERKNCFQITVLLRHVSSLDWRVSLQCKCLLNLKPCN